MDMNMDMPDENDDLQYMDDEQSEKADPNQITKLLESKNIAETLDEDTLKSIGQRCKKGFDADVASREGWEHAMENWIDLAKQVAKPKTYPWKGASNVKYPLVSTASMQFAARAYPSLVPSDRQIVKGKAIGKDPDGVKRDVAEAVSIYMSYQLLEEMDNWEQDMDRLLIMLPVVGVVFKKTYWDSVKKVNCSKLVLPSKLVVDYWAHSLDDAERISEILELSKRKVQERIQSGLWLDEDFGQAITPVTPVGQRPPPIDETTPFTFIEQHTYLDLDDDDYAEPYVITFHKETGKVVRIVARFDEKGIIMDGKDLQLITPIQYYTKFGFIPNPDGSFYDIGFGVLLGPLNESVNTLINQLIDAGHLYSLQSGFLGKGLRLRMGETQFKPGEWKAVNATGGDLKQQIVPLPTKEPSTVLFQLMGSLITSGKELASVAEIFTGKMPGQNTPATTTMATIEQGMKVFTAVYKRIYRSLAEEFQKLYRLNSIYLDSDTYVPEIDKKVGPEIFDLKNHAIFPGADPTAISQTEKLMKAQGLMELLQLGTLDPVEVTKRVLEAQEQPNWEQVLRKEIQQTGQMPPPPPDPKVMAIQQKMQADSAASQQDMQQKAQTHELDTRDKQQQIAMQAQSAAIENSSKEREAMLKAASQQAADRARLAGAVSQSQQTLVQNQQQHVQKMVHGEQQNQQKIANMRAQAAAKPKTPPKKGNSKK